jgi:hypothetical protein
MGLTCVDVIDVYVLVLMSGDKKGHRWMRNYAVRL